MLPIAFQRICTDLTLLYKILHHFSDVDCTRDFSISLSHSKEFRLFVIKRNKKIKSDKQSLLRVQIASSFLFRNKRKIYETTLSEFKDALDR